ncbi:hypothetical protein D3C86_2035660 [compost metagenome]
MLIDQVQDDFVFGGFATAHSSGNVKEVKQFLTIVYAIRNYSRSHLHQDIARFQYQQFYA